MSQAVYSAVIAEAPTSVLVAFYNEYNPSPGSIKKFADRQTAVRRCLKLFQDLLNGGDDPESELLAKLGHAVVTDDPSVFAQEDHGMTHCPSCGIHLGNGVGEHGQDVNGKPVRHDTNKYACLGCGAEFGPTIRRRPAPSADRSAAVAATWDDPAVKASRSERSHVSVGKQTFRSVRDAFVHLGLPLEKHIKFRGLLKAAGTLQFGDHTFTIVTQQAL